VQKNNKKRNQINNWQIGAEITSGAEKKMKNCKIIIRMRHLLVFKSF
jgi:hypothetical protein